MKTKVQSNLVAVALSAVGLVGCGGLASPRAKDGSAGVSFRVSATPLRQLDMVVMVDNSPSAKVTKMNAQFPKLIAALKDPNDGTLPDLRVAVIDSDLGTGCAYDPGTSCGQKTLPDGNLSCLGDLGRFQMLTSPAACAFNAGAEFLEVKNNTAVNFTGPADNINTVFACMASNVGFMGCGEEHSLQAFEFALTAKGIGNEQQQADFLRGNALLALLFISDEDDCSAAKNDGMFGDMQELRGESASLRCATRAHQCGGKNLTDSPPGYPTTASFSAPFSTCAARTDACPNALDGQPSTDTSQPTRCSPLRSVKRMAEEIKALKAYPDNQIVVAGIFGWPLDDQDMATATYKIAPLPNPNTADTQHPTVFDLWPGCYDPNHKPAPATTDATGFDATAAGWGAAPGLRLAAYVDEFGENGLKFSICQPDFSNSMSQIGAKLAKQLQNRCLPASYAQYTNCSAYVLTPASNPKDRTQIIYQKGAAAVPACDSANPATPCYTLASDASPCATGEFLVQPQLGDAANPSPPAGTLLEFDCP
jgi:hypothetical protein